MRKRVVIAVLAVVFLSSVCGCASIFHPSRCSQPSKQRGGVDVGMLALDILWFPVGPIVDFATGAIYTPVETNTAQ